MANAITSQQWQEIEKKLHSGLIVTFSLDDEAIVIKKQCIAKMQLAFFVYINGHIQGSWNQENKPIIRKCWFLKSKSVYSDARKRKLIKELGAKRANELVHLDEKVQHLVPWFTSFKTLKMQYKKLEGLAYVG